ncbi:hypothetical protein [Kitasatospora sp. NPDC087315]|uniref:hypothetical protein n=1 Tax=Kitasatospora sp. NPDC087315 TaxID=3364069 RepID=UPI0037F4F49A
MKRHFPGKSKPGHIVQREETPDWKRRSAAAVFGKVRDFAKVCGDTTAGLIREQKGRFVALCRLAQVHKYIEDPKPSYVADWGALPESQKETDADIFEAVERMA